MSENDVVEPVDGGEVNAETQTDARAVPVASAEPDKQNAEKAIQKLQMEIANLKRMVGETQKKPKEPTALERILAGSAQEPDEMQTIVKTVAQLESKVDSLNALTAAQEYRQNRILFDHQYPDLKGMYDELSEEATSFAAERGANINDPAVQSIVTDIIVARKREALKNKPSQTAARTPQKGKAGLGAASKPRPERLKELADRIDSEWMSR